MPGLVGISKKQDNALDTKQILGRMCQIMKHEDWYKIDTLLDGPIGIGKIGLGILNPEPQPIFNEDKNLCIMMEGEIYDYQYLKKELISKGHTFLVNNDPEFVLHLYEEYRKDFGEKLKDLNGIFLLTIYNIRSHKLIICNDRYGFRPLYWCDRDNYLLFASEIKAILQDRSFTRSVDMEAMAEFFSFGYVLGDKTLIEGVKLLPPASILTYSNGRTEINQYWDWDQIGKVEAMNEGEIIEELGRLWLQAVERRMQGKARIGLSLSGGLDSRAIASAISPKYYPIHAVTFGKSDCDDYKIAKRVANILGIEHYFVEITGGKWFSGVEKTVYIADGLLNIVHLHSWDSIDVMKKYFDICLNGFLGETVAGRYLTTDIMSTKDITQYINVVFKWMNRGKVSIDDEEIFYNPTRLGLLRGLSRKSLAENVKGIIDDPQWSDYFIISNTGRRFVLLGLFCCQKKLEIRMPFFDNDFIEFVYSLPNELRFSHFIYNKMLLKFFPKTYKSIPWQQTDVPIGTNKNIQRIYRYYHSGQSKVNRLLQMIGLPSLFRDDRNYVDYDNWMRSNMELRDHIYNIVLDGRALSRGYFNPDYIRKLIDDHMSRKKNYAEIIGLLLTFELFNRMFIDGDKL